MKKILTNIVISRETKAGRVFGLFIQLLIIISILNFSIETLPDLSNKTIEILNFFELFCVVVFSIEYTLRIFLAPKKTAYIFSFFGIIDLLAILPFYLSLGIDLRSIRVFRLFRLFRILKLVKFNFAIRRFTIALKIIKEELILFSFAINRYLLF